MTEINPICEDRIKAMQWLEMTNLLIDCWLNVLLYLVEIDILWGLIEIIPSCEGGGLEGAFSRNETFWRQLSQLFLICPATSLYMNSSHLYKGKGGKKVWGKSGFEEENTNTDLTK